MYKYWLKYNKTKNSLRSFHKQYIVGEMREANFIFNLEHDKLGELYDK